MNSILSFGLWLKQRRRILDMTQDELAERIGCSVQTIPAGDNTVAIMAFGANGSNGYNSPGHSGTSPGGRGGGVSATLTFVTGLWSLITSRVSEFPAGTVVAVARL